MNELSALKLTLRFPDGARQELTVDADVALIGSGSHCEVRLPSDQAAVEQLEVSASAGGLYGQARSLERPVLLNGVPFVEGRLLPDAILRIGQVELTVELVQSSLAAGTQQQRERSGSPLIYISAIVGFPLGFYLLLGMQRGEPPLPKEVQPPPLFAQVGAQGCAHGDRDAAAAFGSEELSRAEAARERAPFSGRDGIAAVGSFERAAACFGAAQRAEHAERALQAAARLKKSIQNDFHIHRVRLERALATKRYEEARTEVRLLLSYVGSAGGEYTGWLSSLDRQIELKFAGKKRK
jgi:hypothetical protein